jgi:phospholipase/carboxylesterase
MKTQDSATGSPAGQLSGSGLEVVEVSTGPNPTAAVIWLHGLGADGHDFEPVVPQLMWPGAPAVRFVFPHAPVRPVTLNGGMAMRAWYDIVSLSLVEQERQRGIAPDRIVLAGFSQGGAIAVQLAIRYPETLAGLVALSTYLLLEHRLDDDRNPANLKLPVFVGHGTADPMVPFFLGEHLTDRLRRMGHPVESHSYPMPHAVCPEEIADLSAWLRKTLD